VTPEVSIDVDRALTRIALIERRLEELRRKGSGDRGGASAVGALLGDLAKEAGNVGNVLNRASGPASQLNSQFSGMLGAVKQVNPIIQGLALIIIVSLIPALGALVASLSAAIAALGGLGTALAAVAGPILVGALAVFQRIGAVLAARQQHQAALNSTIRKSAAADADHKQKVDALTSAQDSLTNALEGRKAAQEALADAEHGAALAIKQANDAAAAAAQNVKDQQVAAYQAMRDAADAAKQSVLDLASAQLGLIDSKLGIEESQLALKKFREDAGQTGATFDDLFKKLTDVHVDPSKIRGALEGISGQGATGQDQRIQEERLILNVRKAKLQEKQATQDVRTAEEKLADARKTNEEFLRRGIAAYRPYTDALKNAAAANAQVAETERQSARSIEGARRGVAQAERAVAAARRTAAAAAAAEKGNLTAANGPLAVYLAMRKKLSKAERDFLDAIIAAGPILRKFAQNISDPVIGAITRVVKGFGRFSGLIEASLAGLGQTFADNLNGLFKDFSTDPKWLEALLAFGAAARDVSASLGGPILRNTLAILRNIALAVMPILVDGLKQFGRTLGGVRKGTDDTKGLNKTFVLLTKSLSAVFRLVGAVIGVLFDFGKVGGEQGSGFLDSLTAGLRGIGDFITSPKGKKAIQGFFKDTLPFVKSVVSFVGKLALVFLQLFQFLAPALKVVFDGFNFILDVLNIVLSLLNKIPAPIRSLLGFFFPWEAVLARIFGLVGKLLGPFRKLGEIGGKAAGTILKPFGGLAGKLGSLIGVAARVVGRVAGRIFGVFRGIASAWLTPYRIAFRAIRDFLGGAFGGIVRFLGNQVERVAKIAGKIKDALVGAFKGIAGRLKGLFVPIAGVLKGALNGIIDVINAVIGAINKVTPNKHKINLGLKTITIPGIPDIPKVPRLARGGIAVNETLATIGDAGREAVLPLTTAVLRQLGQSIVRSLATGPSVGGMSPALAAAGGGGGGGDQHFHLPPAPAAQVPDAAFQASQLGRLMRRRGGTGGIT
jgi:phage-related protein